VVCRWEVLSVSLRKRHFPSPGRAGHGGFLGLASGRPMVIHSSTSGIYWPVPSPDGKRVYYVSGLERREFVRFDRKRREFVPFLPGIAGGGLLSPGMDAGWPIPWLPRRRSRSAARWQ